MFLEPFGSAELLIEVGQDFWNIELERPGIAPDKAANVDGRGKNFVISVLERFEMVRPDFGLVRHFSNSALRALARVAQSFANHSHENAAIVRKTSPPDNEQN